MVGEALLCLSRAKSAMNLKHLFTVATVVLISALIVASLSRPSHKLCGSEVIPIKGAFGPESFAFDPAGEGPYTGVSDGRIIKWQENERRWIDFAVTAINRLQVLPYNIDTINCFFEIKKHEVVSKCILNVLNSTWKVCFALIVIPNAFCLIFSFFAFGCCVGGLPLEIRGVPG